MATEVAAPTRWVANQWENNCGYSSAVCSGIVPDKAHLRTGGPHCSIEDLVAHGNGGDYSNRRALDKAPPVTAKGRRYGAAVDMSVSKADMIKMYGRVKKVFDDRSDPRRRYINAINVWNGQAGVRPTRFDFQTNTAGTTDRSHEWHGHADQPRAYVDVHRNETEAWTAARALISVLAGETKQQWTSKETPVDKATIKAAVLEAFDTVVPYRATGPLSRLKAVKPQGWSDVSLRQAIDYCFEHAVGVAKSAEITALRAVVDQLAAAIGKGASVDTAAVIAHIDKVAAVEAARDAAAAAERARLLDLLEQAGSGKLTATEVVERLREMLHAATAPAVVPVQG